MESSWAIMASERCSVAVEARCAEGGAGEASARERAGKVEPEGLARCMCGVVEGGGRYVAAVVAMTCDL
jgi:hypothetical protein